jgi:hypothetical protein
MSSQAFGDSLAVRPKANLPKRAWKGLKLGGGTLGDSRSVFYRSNVQKRILKIGFFLNGEWETGTGTGMGTGTGKGNGISIAEKIPGNAARAGYFN